MINQEPQNKVPFYGSNGDGKFIIETPDYLKKEIVDEFGEYFDPCPVNPKEDGLKIDWDLDKINYVNPPYSRGQIKLWVKKCDLEFKKGAKIVLLIPAYTDTKYFHEYIYQKPYLEIRFLKGRIKFKGYQNASSFPSMLVLWGLGK